MKCNNLTILCGALLGAVLAAPAATACDLKVENAWIRTPPPGVPALAGYAEFVNAGSKPLVLGTQASATFAAVELHETIDTNGMSRMRAVPKLTLAPGERVALAPGGKHLMLMQPKSALKRGDHVVVAIRDGSGCTTSAHFVVQDGPAEAAAAQHHHH
jgi:copper(I)-binding protein